MKLSTVMAIALVLIQSVSLISPWISPEKYPIFNIFSVLHLWLYFIVFLTFILYALSRNKAQWLLLLSLLVNLPSMSTFIQLSSEEESEADLSLMTYNIGAFYPQSKKAETLRLLDSLGSVQPDLLVTQECNGYLRKQLTSLSQYPYQYQGETMQGPLILSRYPLVRSGEIRTDSPVNGCLWSDIAIGKDTLRIYNIHLRSSRISRETDDLISGQLKTNREAMDQSKTILRNFLSTSRVRAAEAKAIKEHSLKSPYPAIIAGDFNETAHSYVYRVLSSKKKDSFAEIGNGMGISYRGKIPALRIDFALLPKSQQAIRHEVKKWDFSDHNAVFVHIER